MNPKKSFNFFLHHQSHIPTGAKYSLFLKRRIKYTGNIHLEEQTLVASKVSLKCQKMLFKVGKLVKYSPTIDLLKFQGISCLKLSKLQRGIKRFKNLKEVRLPSVTDKANFAFYKMLLKQCKNMTSYASYLPIMAGFRYIRSTDIRSKNKETFVKAFGRKKLKKVDIFTSENLIGFPFTKYPSSLQEISFQFRMNFLTPFPPETVEEFKQPFSHIKNLKHLDLFIATHPAVLSLMLSSIHSPDNLKSLGVFVGSIREADLDSIPGLVKALQPFQNLKRLKIIIVNPQPVLDILRVFTDNSLESFEIDATFVDETQLSSIGYFLGSLRSLKYLIVRMKNKAEIHVPEAYISFFHQISELTQLKTFQCLFESTGVYRTKSDGPEVLSAVSDCISKLPELKEFAFQYLKKDSGPYLSILTKTLKQNCQNLQRLRLYFFTNKLENKNLTAFLQTLGRMEKLEDLLLAGLQVKNENSSKEIFETVYNLPNLRALVLSNNITIRREVLLDLVIKTALKKKTEMMTISGVLQLKGAKSYKNQITLEDIQRRNPNLIEFFIHPDLKQCFFPSLNS